MKDIPGPIQPPKGLERSKTSADPAGTHTLCGLGTTRLAAVFFMSLVLLLLISTTQFLSAYPQSIPGDDPPTSSPLISDQCECPNTRTLFDIIWSCFSTIFICTWVSVHPNLPPAGEPFLWTCLRRLKIMLYTFLLPELTLSWALTQWFGAKKVVEAFKDRGWTKTHGFFLVMGGFHLHRGEEDLGVLSLDLLSELTQSNEITFPSISSEELQDKSKGDFITKGIAILQTSWFIVQCIARGVQGLVITELELLTLALASMNAAMYFFWWEKPLDVHSYVPVYLKEGVEFMHKPKLKRVNMSGEEKMSRELDRSVHPTSNSWAAYLPKAFRNVTSSLLRYIFIFISRRQDEWAEANPIFFTLKWFFILPIILIILPVIELTSEADHFKPGDKRVPTFYALPIGQRNDYIAGATFAFFGVGFGGLHMIAWGFSFPSRTMRLLWRSSALAVTVIPFATASFATLPFLSYDEDADERWRNRNWWDSLVHMVRTGLAILAVLLFAVYIPARFILVVEGLMLLKNLSQGAYVDIEWTKFIPHLR